MTTKGTIAFDMIGTCFSLDQPRQKLIQLGASSMALELWFTQTLRDAFALSHAGQYCPLKEILQAELPRTLELLGVEASEADRSQVISAFGELTLQPGAEIAFSKLVEDNWRLVALTNGSEASTRTLLEQAHVLTYFDQIFSCDTVQKTKPHPAVYDLVKAENTAQIWLVAAHAWDVMGAATAGLKTAFLTQTESLLAVYPQPDIVAIDLIDAANQIRMRG